MRRMSNASLRILAIESSGKVGSVAVGDAERVLAEASLPGRMRHAAALVPRVDDLCRRAGWTADSVTQVYVSIGPGSFTGLRIGVALARTLAWSIGAKIVAVPTMEALARNAWQANPVPEHVAILLDAKRDQIYTACYALAEGRCRLIHDACLADPAAFLETCPKPLAVLGEGIPQHRQAAAAPGITVLEESLWPGRAANVWAIGRRLAEQGNFTTGGDLLPRYIRLPDVVEKWQQRHAAS